MVASNAPCKRYSEATLSITNQLAGLKRAHNVMDISLK